MKSGKIMTMSPQLRAMRAANDGPLPSKAKAYEEALSFCKGHQDMINYDPEIGEFYYVLWIDRIDGPILSAEFPFNPE